MTHPEHGAPAPVDFISPETPVDLTNCDREPIHIIGHVQPHGALLALGGPEMRVEQASANTAAVLGVAPEALLGRPLAELLGAEQAAAVAAAAGRRAERSHTHVRLTMRAGGEERAFDGAVSPNAAGPVVELEPARGAALPVSAFAAALRETMARVDRARSVREAAQVVAEQVHALTGFDRVWVYEFHEDWHGEVIAEAQGGGIESWLGLHYPASDIPAQARALFVRHWVRLIADVQYAPAPLVPQRAPATGAELDLSDAVLRGVSPMHLQYLTNMGVRASMSVSLVRDGQLWGLVSCHHYGGPVYVPQDVRTVCELLAQALSAQLGMADRAEDNEYALHVNAVEARLLERMAREPEFVRALVDGEPNLLDLCAANGAALCLGGEVVTAGDTPSGEQIDALLGWLAESAEDAAAEPFATSALGESYPAAAEYRDLACGLLAVPLSAARRDYVLWFRPQVVQRVAWAGDPRKPVEVSGDGVARLSPRGSFAKWEEEVHGRALPWRTVEVDAARRLRGTLVDFLIKRADEIKALNAELERSNAELDAFAYVAAHDLKEPLRGIHNYAAILKEDYAGRTLDDDATAKLETVGRLTQRLDTLLDSLFHYSRVGRLTLDREWVALDAVLTDVMDRLIGSLASSRVDVRVPRPLPEAWVDRDRAAELLFNLLSNAIKYTVDRPDPWVEVGYLDAVPEEMEVPGGPLGAGERVFYVRDNGIGIAPRHHEVVFRLFKRLHAREAYGGGGGAGLTIVRKVAERHGGRVWIDSALGAGATFYFTFGAADDRTAHADDGRNGGER